MKKVLTVLLTLILVIVSAVAVADTDTYTVAVIGPITGAAAVYGTGVANGAKIAAEEINKNTGYEALKLIILDDTHDAEVALNAYNSALDQNAQVIIGTVTTTPCIAVSAQAYEDRVFMLTPSASSTAVTADKDNCYQLCFTDPAQGTLSAQYILNNNLGSTIGVIYNNADAYSTGIYQTFVAEVAKQGKTVAAVQTFNETTTDFSVQVAAMKQAGCDVVFLPIYYTPASQIIIRANATDYSPVFFGVDGMDGILTLTGFDTALAEGVMLLTPFSADASDELTVNFVNMYTAAFDTIPNQFAADAYDCVYAIYNAMVKGCITGDTTPEEACEILISVFSGDFEVTGLTGTMTWSANGEVTKTPNAVIIKNGAYVSPENY